MRISELSSSEDVLGGPKDVLHSMGTTNKDVIGSCPQGAEIPGGERN